MIMIITICTIGVLSTLIHFFKTHHNTDLCKIKKVQTIVNFTVYTANLELFRLNLQIHSFTNFLIGLNQLSFHFLYPSISRIIFMKKSFLINRSMLLSSDLVDPICQQVLCHQCDAHMRRDSEVKRWETHPKFCHSLILYCFAHRIKDVLVWELTICVFLHLLDLCLCIVKWQTDKR